MGLRYESVADVLAALATNQPAAPALHVPGRRSLTFGDLGTQIRYVRERLGGWGIAPGDIVVGVVPSRPEMAVACATFPSSSTFAPLSPTLATDVYAQLILRMGAKAALVPKDQDHPLRVAARQHGIPEIDVVAEPDAPAGLFTLDCREAGDSRRTTPPARPELDYIQVSSGTTGRPKLVLSTHRKTILYARAATDWLAYSPSDVSCHLTPLHLGAGLRSSLLNPLLGGLSIVCLPESDVDALFAAIEEFQPTCLSAGFTLQRAMLRRAPDYRDALRQSRFRFLRAGTGRLEPEEIDRLEQAFGAPLLVAYQSTETSAISHDPLPPRRRKRGAVGLPLVNDVGVMDDAGRISATDAMGEIVVRGPLLFSGYLDDPELTAASFAGDWFRTGDLGRIDDEGYVYLSGRIKEMINRGGEKISPAEIDVALESLPGVREAATFGIPHPSLGEEIVAALVRHADAAIDEAQVIEHVRRRMGPHKKVPRRIYFVDRIPRTGNGKVRRLELPHMLGLDSGGATQDGGPGADAAPASLSPLEGALAGLWASLLQVGNVGRADDFFLLGGDSLRAVQLIAHVKALFGVELQLQALFGEAATVGGMARTIETIREADTLAHENARGAAGRSVDAAIPRRLSHAPVVLTHTQRRAWFLARLDPDNPAYNESRAYQLSGPLDIEALRASLRAVVERHEILRTTYTVIDDEPRQIVPKDWSLALECVDLSLAPAGGRDEILSSVLSDETQEPFDLERGPLARFRLVRLGDNDHVLLRVWHHIVSDGWSSGIFERELSQAYNARVAGREAALPALPLQYADYALWQRQWLSGEVLDRQLGYWKDKLAHLPTLELPTDHPRPAVQSYRGARLEMALPPGLTDALKALGRAEGATLFMTLLAAFQVLLHRYSGAEDIAVGTPIAGRRRPELEGLIGFFANTLVLRTDLSGNPPFRELLARVRESALDAYTHQDLPFEKLVAELSPARDMSRNPLFQVLFALQQASGTALVLDGVQAARVPLQARTAKFDLSLALRESSEGLQARWEYSTDLFEASTIERMAGHFECLLAGIVADSGQRIGQLPVLGAAERHRLLVGWNDTTAEYPRDRGVHQLFEAQAARTPEAVAAVFEAERLTYGELNTRANRLAHRLIGLGVGPEVLVGVCMERSLELIVGLLAILKAGGAYVPLDPGYPPRRLAFMLEDTAAPVLLTQQRLLGRLPSFEGRILCLDGEWPVIGTHDDTNPTTTATCDSLCYVIYTSGSTGKPKGVAVNHGTLVNLMAWHGQDAPEGRVAQFTSISFDVSLQEILHALTSGKTLIVVPTEMQLRPEKLAAFIHDAAITDLFVPTIVLEHLARATLEAQRHLSALANVYQAGEALTITPVLQEFFAKHRECRLHNHYGPAESHVVTTATLPADAESWPYRPVIGVPIRNVRIYILDQHGEPVPVGVPGELCIGGAALARGYLNRPDLTAERFRRDPFSATPGARMYHTGDLARYLTDGRIECLGRIDDQVKIRGFRIEPAEIEAVLSEHPTVRQAVVLAREDVPGNRRLVAYVVPADTSFTDIERLRAFMRERLPQYMLPSAFVELDRLPLTPNGKIDRHALPAPPAKPAGAQAAPHDDVEATLGSLWAQALGVERVDLDDNFFELGGHSLLAASLFARQDRAFGRLVPLATIFEAPTIRGLARFYRGPVEPASSSSLVPITSGGSLPPLFALPGIGGNVLGYAHLAQELGVEQPFYGLQSVGLDGLREPLEDIEEMATDCLAEIRQLQPRGPYHLLGACFGGVVAFEIAHQLIDAGESVAFLGLLNPSTIGSRTAGRRRLRLPRVLKRGLALGGFVLTRIRMYRSEMRGLGILEKVRFVRGKVQILGQASRDRALFRGNWREFYQHRVEAANLRALRCYRREPLKRPAGAFEILATDQFFTRPSRSMNVDWGPLASGLVVCHRVPGTDSGDMLREHNGGALAALLRERLARATRRGEGRAPAATVRAR